MTTGKFETCDFCHTELAEYGRDGALLCKACAIRYDEKHNGGSKVSEPKAGF